MPLVRFDNSPFPVFREPVACVRCDGVTNQSFDAQAVVALALLSLNHMIPCFNRTFRFNSR